MCKPFSVGQKIGCSHSTYFFPHVMRRPLVVESVRLMKCRYIAPYYRVKAHVEGRPDLWVEGSADRFWAA
jgi:hypothetical protein